MAPEVIDGNRQRFGGRIYTRLGNYFRKSGTFLHRDVWVAANGPIPDGHHIHHLDGDGSNNCLSNLESMHGREHISMHNKGHGRRPEAALAALTIWRKTEVGQAQALAMGKKNAHHLRKLQSFTCDRCSSAFEAEPKGVNRFCSTRCKQASHRASGSMLTTRRCVVCEADFSTNKYRPGKTCSAACRGVISGTARSGVAQPKRKAWKQPERKGIV